MNFVPVIAQSATTTNTLAIIALVIGMVNGVAAIINFVLSRVRLPRVRHIGTQFVLAGPVPAQAERKLTVDVLNYGAAISDLEVWIRVFIPPWLKDGKSRAGTRWFALEPVGTRINPLNSGQAMEFLLSSNIFRKYHDPQTGKEFDHFAATMEHLKDVPLRYVSLCIYSNGKRNLLRRIRSKRFHWAFDNFFGHPLKAPIPWRNKLEGRLITWSHGETAQRIRSKVDRWKLGYFDFKLHQFFRFIGIKDESPDHFRPRSYDDN